MISLPRKLLLFSFALQAALFAMEADAAPTLDDNLGLWNDTFVDNAGISNDPTLTSNVEYNPFSRSVTIAPGQTSGEFATVAISPVSFFGWGDLLINYSAANPADIQVFIRDEDSLRRLRELSSVPSRTCVLQQV